MICGQVCSKGCPQSPDKGIQSWTRVLLQDLESKKGTFYSFCSNGSAVEKLKKHLFYNC